MQGDAARPDLLARTTLQLDASMSTPALARVIGALQRVPGVLLAEMNATRAVVAHDAAVPNASLVAAAAQVGVRAEVVTDKRATRQPIGTPRLWHLPFRQLMMIATAALVSCAFIDVMLPNSAQKHWLLIMFMGALWGFVFTEAILRRRS